MRPKFIAQTNLDGNTDIMWEVNGDVQTIATLFPVIRFTACGPDDYDKEMDEEKTDKVREFIMAALNGSTL